MTTPHPTPNASPNPVPPRIVIALARGTPALGRRVRELRHRAGLSVATLAALAGLNTAQLFRIEHGTENPRINHLVRIAVALDTSVADLVRDMRSP